MKYGFVYIWYDKKHKRFYIGCHWGKEDDGYVCSSPWMRQAFRLRPHDFKRRIIKNNIKTREELFNEEQRWLNMIKLSEISPNTKTPRYYNLKIFNNGHWCVDESKMLTIKEKISKANKGKRYSPSTEFKRGVSASPATEFKKGQKAHNKGMTLEERYGKEKADNIRAKYRKAKLGKPSTSSSKFQKGHIPWNAKYNLDRCN